MSGLGTSAVRPLENLQDPRPWETVLLRPQLVAQCQAQAGHSMIILRTELN